MKKIYLLFSLVFGLTALFLLNKPGLSYALEAGWSITAPASVNLPGAQWGIAQQQTTVDFSDPIVISNNSSSTTGFTANVTSTEFLHDTDVTLFMGYGNLEIKTGPITTDQPTGLTAPINGTYTAFSGGLSTSDGIDFMAADVTNKNAGSWSITPSLRLTIPAKQKVGNYTSTLTFSLY